MTSTRDALEAALVRDPDDVTLHMAYADCLIEEGDPRGEFVRLSLEKESADRTPAEKAEIGKAIRRLRAAHGATWKGDFARYLTYDSFTDNDHPELLLRWKRGWIHHFQATPFDAALIPEVLRHPYLKLTRTVILYHSEYERLARPPTTDFSFLRELPTPVVRSFALASRAFDDAALEHLLAAPYLTRIMSLSLNNTILTDAGAQRLLEHPHTAALKSLSLEGTLLTPAGCELFRRIGKRIENRYPYVPWPYSTPPASPGTLEFDDLDLLTHGFAGPG